MVGAAEGRTLAAQPLELSSVLHRLAERTQQYYDRFVSIICTETVHQQELRFNLAPVGKPRVTVYELSVSRNPNPKPEHDFRVDRVLQLVNGRAARKHQEPECTDPKTGTPDLLGFLLAKSQAGYLFTLPETTTKGPEGTRALDFIEKVPERVEVSGSADCFEVRGGREEGRLWFDPGTFDVLQVDLRLFEPFLVPLPTGYFGLRPGLRVERWEARLRFARVNFTQPDETVLLPESIETLTVFRGAASRRTVQRLTNFQRFLAESTIRPFRF